MEIRRWHYYVIFNCVIIKYLEAKTISLNDVIAAESQQKEAFETTLPPKLTASTGKRVSLWKRLASTSRVKKLLESGLFLDHSIFGGKKISPLTYKKTFLIKSPLKPQKLTLIQKSRFKRKNQSVKREIHGNEELKQKYIPLLKSLSMLFDYLLNSDESESYEVKTKKFKRNRFYSGETFEVPHKCTHQFVSGTTESKPQEKTITISPSITTETTFATENLTISEATSATTNSSTTRDFSTFRQNKNIPVLLPRDTSSSRRNDNGISERSSATLHGDIEGNITRHHGDHEHAAGCGQNDSCAEDDAKSTDGFTRDGARGFRSSESRGVRNHTRISPRRNRKDDENNSKTETTNYTIRENQFENRGDETESARILQESIRRLRGFTSEDVNQTTESVQPEKVREESILHVTHDSTGYQRFTDRGSSIATEDQKVRERNETITSIRDNLNTISSQSQTPRKKSPIVMIFDGYSVARHKNGENKFSEKSIRIHS